MSDDTEYVRRMFNAGVESAMIANRVERVEFDRWLNNLMAETWHEGACNYYDANPYGTQAKDA